MWLEKWEMLRNYSWTWVPIVRWKFRWQKFSWSFKMSVKCQGGTAWMKLKGISLRKRMYFSNLQRMEFFLKIWLISTSILPRRVTREKNCSASSLNGSRKQEKIRSSFSLLWAICTIAENSSKMKKMKITSSRKCLIMQRLKRRKRKEEGNLEGTSQGVITELKCTLRQYWSVTAKQTWKTLRK